MTTPTVSARCGVCSTRHPLAALASRLLLVGDGPRLAWCPSCKAHTPLQVTDHRKVPA